MAAPIRLLLVEDHLMMRAALRLLLLGYPHLEVVAESESCEGALELVGRHHPDVVLLDIFLADKSSVDCIALMRAKSPRTRILMLTGSPDTTVHGRAMAQGAQGVVRKEESPEVLLQAIERVNAGHLWFSARIERLPAPEENTNTAVVTDGTASLTAREREVMELIGEGLRNSAIASRMGVSGKTVQHHLTSIFRKLEVNDRLELAAFAHRTRPLKPPSD
ncbi:transcriptional regulatory protein DegU [Abditibacteriota bacterium]|nr:transcriptional regulatory protein DegU [Abditibacteriota bacterium]